VRSSSKDESGKKPQSASPLSKGQATKAVAVKVEVILSAIVPVVIVRAMRTARRAYAVRTIELRSDGISVNCDCEKVKCPASGWIHRPRESKYLSAQIEEIVEKVRIEYSVPQSKEEYYIMYGTDRRPARGFKLPSIWMNEPLLELARQGFDAKR